MVKIGQHVIFIDELRVEHDALLENVFDGGGDETKYPTPAVNLVYVVVDTAAKDQYGGQKKHPTSVVHISGNSAQANCWKLPTE